MTCNHYEGIEAIKKALKKGQQSSEGLSVIKKKIVRLLSWQSANDLTIYCEPFLISQSVVDPKNNNRSNL